MTSTSSETGTGAGAARCGCCGRSLPADRLTELGSTPGVFICDGCALWAARRTSRVPIIRLDLRGLVHRLRDLGGRSGPVAKVIPILPSADLDRTAAFYRGAGMEEVERFEGYLLMQFRGVELHFTSGADSPTGQAFVMVPDAGRLWKQLKSQDVAGLGPVEDLPHGLREFVVIDPDGNRIRVGSPIPG